MKKFILQICCLVISCAISILLIFFQADGYADPYYLRFTTPQQSSLILGSSRAAQGIQPQILDSVLERADFFNYSFTIGTSPYGDTFLKSIKKKLDPATTNGIFILCVDPWSISNRQPQNLFKEETLFLGTTRNVNQKPNIPYLWNSFDDPYYKLFFNKLPISTRTRSYLHEDGWLELISASDSKRVKKNTTNRIREYQQDYLPYYQFSPERLNALEKTIDFLKGHGNVYLVQLPASSMIMQLDSALIPDFSLKIDSLSKTKEIPFLDLSRDRDCFSYSDGIHLTRASGCEVSRLIGEWISAHRSYGSTRKILE